jgi:hypothetical protein
MWVECDQRVKEFLNLVPRHMTKTAVKGDASCLSSSFFFFEYLAGTHSENQLRAM